MAWPVNPQVPALAESDVHIWLADLSYRADALGHVARILSEDERERATRFHFPQDAGRWTVSRAVLRSILGHYLGVDASAVRFGAGPWGKPELTADFRRHLLEFSASRSEGLGLYAVARNRRVGVDIERLRPLPDLAAIAAQVFSPREQRALEELPAAERDAAFFDCWTRKEAYLKALGEGLGHEVAQDDSAEPGRWSISPLAPAPGYAAALALEGPPSKLFCAQWRGAC